MMQFSQNKFISKLIKLGVFFLVFWTLFLLGRALWQNWDLKRSILKLNEQLITLQQQKKDLENLNLYYSSDSFKELEARKRLGLKKSGEKLVVLPASPNGSQGGPATTPGNFSEELDQEKKSIAGVTTPTKIPNWLLWWQYFTK